VRIGTSPRVLQIIDYQKSSSLETSTCALLARFDSLGEMRLTQGRVGMCNSLRAFGSVSRISCLPSGRSNVQHEVSLKNGCPKRMLKFARTVTCTWKYMGPAPKLSGTFSITPNVESHVILTDSILRL